MQQSDKIKCDRVWRPPAQAATATSASNDVLPVAGLGRGHVALGLRWLAGMVLFVSVQGAHGQADSGEARTESGAILLTNLGSPSGPLPALEPLAEATSDLKAEQDIDRPDTTDRPASRKTGPIDLRQLIAQVARESGVSADLIAAVAAAESRFDPAARSPKGALGLMQLMPATAERFGVHDVWAVEDNLRGGAAYLRWLLDLFKGDTRLAVAAYNAGEHAVLKAGRQVPAFNETRRYVPKVLAWRDHYAAEFASTDVGQAATGKARESVGASGRAPVRRDGSASVRSAGANHLTASR
ncbi:MAG: hypothetical protein RL375_152 [Pseudomonadota bacterium]